MNSKLKERIKKKIRNIIGHNELFDMLNRLVKASENWWQSGSGDSFWKEFSGFTSEDIPLLQKYIYKEALSGKDGYITDFLGIRHKVGFFPKDNININGVVFQKLPIPGDGFHSETIEYVACLTSIENAGSSYTMFELGAGWGPWMSIAGTAAKRKGIKTINLIGVEGEHEKMSFIKNHLTENKLRPDTEDMKTYFNGVNTIIYDGVINTTGEDAEFLDSPPNEYGSSIVEKENGNSIKTKKVKGYSLTSISTEYEFIDFIHIDIQGYEFELILKSLDILRKKVKFLFIGTHSREIEGKLINILYENNFKLIREQPCRVSWPESKPDNFVSVTVKDGGQFWINKQLNN
jgi:hypothetical protein